MSYSYKQSGKKLKNPEPLWNGNNASNSWGLLGRAKCTDNDLVEYLCVILVAFFSIRA